MSQTTWNDAEDDALNGLPWAAQILYLRGLRRFMDYATGLVGVRRRVSWQGLREVLHVPSHQGMKEVALDKDQLRRTVRWLEKAGLVEVRTEGRQLVFFLPLADADKSVSKKATPRPHHPSRAKAAPIYVPRPHHPKYGNGAGFDGAGSGEAASTRDGIQHHRTTPKAAPHPVSGKPKPSTPQAASTAEPGLAPEAAAAAMWSAAKVEPAPSEHVRRRATAIVVRLRQQGVTATAMHPTVVSWAEQGIRDEDIDAALALAQQARAAEDSTQPVNVGFLHAKLQRVLRPPKPQVEPWWSSVAAMEAKARELGIAGARPGEEKDAFAARIKAAILRGGEEAA